jgi:hypothetical protein
LPYHIPSRCMSWRLIFDRGDGNGWISDLVVTFCLRWSRRRQYFCRLFILALFWESMGLFKYLYRSPKLIHFCSFKLIHLTETEWEGIFFSNRQSPIPISLISCLIIFRPGVMFGGWYMTVGKRKLDGNLTDFKDWIALQPHKTTFRSITYHSRHYLLECQWMLLPARLNTQKYIFSRTDSPRYALPSKNAVQIICEQSFGFYGETLTRRNSG